MKAFLLAAGMGTRLQPLTLTTPKCLVPINGTPLLGIWIDHLAANGITDILINTHHLAGQVTDYLDKRRNRPGPRISIAHEESLLGSGGTLLANKNFVAGEDAFLIIYADNLTNINLRPMIGFHRNRISMGCVLTMALFQAPDPSACGIATLAKDGKIINFIEKPKKPPGDLANAGIYVSTPALFDYYPADRQGPAVLDLGHHVLPRLTGRMYGFIIDGYLKDIGTLAAYATAQREWPPERN